MTSFTGQANVVVNKTHLLLIIGSVLAADAIVALSRKYRKVSVVDNQNLRP